MSGSGERIGTTQYSGFTAGDAARWLLALVIVSAFGAGGVLLAPQLTLPAGDMAEAAPPAILLELAPVAEPEPEVIEPEPVVEPEPEPVVEEPPPEPEVTPPEAESKPPVVEPEPLPEPPVAEPVEPPPVVEPEPEPEPLPEPEPEPLPEPEPIPEPDLAPAVTLPMPATMSADLRERREETPATNPQRPHRDPPPERPQQQAAPQPQQAVPAAQPAAASGPSPEQWQQQVLQYLERRKVYPREAEQAGQTGVAAITFTINASGQVLSVSLARSSGVPSLDQAALDTARRASPLPRPPASMGGNITLTASIRFTLR